MPIVALMGDINVDVLMPIGSYPGAGGDAMASQVILRPGGSVANTAIVLAKLGVVVRMIGCTGNDIWADLALDTLISTGVDVEAVTRNPEYPTGLIFIPITEDGERTMFSYRGANTNITPQETHPQVLTDTQFLHISAYNFLKSPQKEATTRLVELAQNKRIPISMDVGVEPSYHAKVDILSMLPLLEYLVLGLEEARILLDVVSPEDVLTYLFDSGIRRVGLKFGPQGCTIADIEKSYKLPGFPMETIDTTGAGDAFCAGLLFGHLNGLSLPASGFLANLLGGLATTVWGCGHLLPGREEIISYLRKHEIPPDLPEMHNWADEILGLLIEKILDNLDDQ